MKYVSSEISALGSMYFCRTDTGLGNVLFQVASVYGIAKKLGIACTFPRLKQYFKNLKEQFNYDHGTTILRNAPILDADIKFKVVSESFLNEGKECNKMHNTDLIKMIESGSENISIRGHLENSKYFSHAFDEIKEMFSCDVKTDGLINQRYEDLLSSNTVAVHFRDFSKVSNKLIQINPEYYRKAIKYICERVEDPLFLIFTDNKNCVDETLFDGYDYRFIENEVDYIDLYTMSKCKHSIISASTFSWWAAFLNKNPDKIVLYNSAYPFEYLKMFIPV